ncbi:General negative regulator of transcription subunit 1 [Wickerhamiella sorbophila]|uniref:General negative regulator of transcription subunit 1 n=1 Tax=Wickerhamiella sorbophila TaxID=45607 RepID=A0A2T0FIH1_9ASCO|nr:General negative regulator of transcription subunit 1 [Wickerhamiella sorbophila]PRT54801.1 General negative regulator of transcription subunit 1 [Wickerhamiella sorbophila]
MDLTLAEKLSSLAGKTFSFGKLEPEQVPVREVTAGQMAGVLGLVTTRPDVQVAQLARALASKSTRINWPQVFEYCDAATSHPFNFTLASPDSVAAAIALISGTGHLEGVNAFLARKWKTLSLQIQLLSSIASLPPARLNLSGMGVEKVVSEGPLVTHPLNFVFLIHLALDAVCREPPNEITAKTFLDTHVKLAPDLFLSGGVQMPKPWPSILERILINLFALTFSESPDLASPVLIQLREKYPSFLYLACWDLYVRDPSQLDRIALYSAGNGQTMLDEWLEQEPKTGFAFVLEIVAAADRLEISSARDLLVAKFVTGGPDAVIALLDFMELKMSAAAAAAMAAAQGAPAEPLTNPLTLRTVAAFETLTVSMDIPPDRMEQLKAIQVQCLQVYPRLINFGQGHDDAILANNDLPTFPLDVEQEMKTCFQQMYENQLQIREVITMLEQLKESDEPRDQDLFACMVHSLFDEYRFFPDYPVNALATTAVLFGSLIHFRLIDNVPLSIALRFILESLKQHVESNMFRFGLQALFELRQRLPEFPKYCSVLLTIPGLASQQQLYQQIKDIVYPPTSLEVAFEDNNFKSLNSDVGLPPVTIEVPPEALKDKVLFIVNNLAPSNVKERSRELAATMNKRYYAWFAEYIITERAMNEPNYHELYISMLATINSKAVLLHCLRVIYMHVVRLVNDEDALAASKRTQLKNLGIFLGSLLLARDKPIMHDNINFKLLLAEASNTEKLPAVLPFIGKTLDKCANSKVFAPPSPWLMGIMAVLAELYQFGNLKLNLKFEIEVLCNALGLSISEITPATFIRSEEAIHLEQEMKRLALDPTATIPTVPVGPSVPGVAGLPNIPGAVPGAFEPPFNQSNMEVSPLQISTASLQLMGQTDFVTHPTLRRFFEIAIGKTIQEVLLPVVERAASIASFTTKELVLKDFALDSNEKNLERAAHNMASMLAMSMSLVTAKDPFAESLVANLRQFMIQNNYREHTAIMDQIPIAVRDNIDTIISLAEVAARDRAIAEIDEALLPAYAVRQQYKQAVAAGQNPEPFVDQMPNEFALQLPEPLGLRYGGLLPQQLAVYDEFYSPAGEHVSGAFDPVSAPAAVPAAAVEQAVAQIESALERLQVLIGESTAECISDLGPDNAIFVLMSQMLTLGVRSPARDELMLKTSQLVVSQVFKPGIGRLQRECLCFFLGKLCELNALTAKEVVLWLIYSDDDRKYNVEVISILLRARLVTASEVDVNLVKEILARNKLAISFAAGLILDAVLGEHPYCLRTDFTGLLEAMEVLVREDGDDVSAQTARSVLNALQKSRGEGWSPLPKDPKLLKGKAAVKDSVSGPSLKDKMGYVFAEWTRLVQHPCCTLRSLHLFVYTLHQHNILSHTEPLYTFVRTALEGSVESYGRSFSSGAPVTEAFVGVDSLAKLLVTVFQTSESMPTAARNQYAHGLLMVCALVLADQHEKDQEQFNGCPYFRLFSTLLYEISVADDGSTFWQGLLLSVAQVLQTLQPLALPGFTSSWITLISHRHLMPRLMTMPGRKGWNSMNALLEALLRFMGVYNNAKSLSGAAQITYKGLLRVMLVILHDFPEFLVENWYGLCNLIPSSFVQLRNLVLSAFPPKLELPDPMALPSATPINYSLVPPTGDIDFGVVLAKYGIRRTVDQALRPNGVTAPIVSSIISSLSLAAPKRDVGADFDTVAVSLPGYNALVMYIAQLRGSGEFDPDSPAAVLCTRLLNQLNSQGRFVLLSTMANQLRYPNLHTYFYSQYILWLFLPTAATVLKDNTLEIRHIATRVLLERIICNRPHPWGLMATFVQLLKNPKHKFWSLPFVKIAPEIEEMFTSLYTHITAVAA